MTITATLEITRNDETVAVDLWAHPEWFGSHNTNENGYKIGDWGVSTLDIELTENESIRALELLEREIRE